MAPTTVSHTAHRDRPHYVYRAYDARDRLLYVGCTMNVPSRMSGHRSAAKWPALMTRLRVVGPFSFERARMLESEAFNTERPWYNSEEPHRARALGMWDQIQHAATRIANHDGWILNDCHMIGDRVAAALFPRPNTGEPFDAFFDYHKAVDEHRFFMSDQIPPVRHALWSLLASGWEPECGSKPRWAILPRGQIG